MALDPVNPKALKGKFKDSKDKDIDNDGDTDSSDEYLHKRRQAVSKAINKKVEEAKMTPDQMKKALASAKAQAQPKDKVSLKKPPFKMDEVSQAKAAAELSLRAYGIGSRDKFGYGEYGDDHEVVISPKTHQGKIIKSMGMHTAKKQKREEANLDEVSQELATRAYGRRSRDAAEYGDSGDDKEMNKSYDKGQKTLSTIKKKYGKDGEDKANQQSSGLVYGGKKPYKEEVDLDEAVNEKQIRKDLDSGMSHDVVIGKHANKKTTNTDEIRKVIKQHAFEKRMKKESVDLDEAKLPAHIIRGDKFDGVPDGIVAQAKATVRKMNLDRSDQKQEAMYKALSDLGWEMTAAGKFVKESVVLKALRRISEAKDAYTVAHKSFSSAVQHAEEVAKKRGFEIDPEEWDRKVSMGPRKPGAGKTNSYKIDLMKDGKEVKQKLNMQVYYDEGRYELNMYIS
jgi:hypothetical protein